MADRWLDYVPLDEIPEATRNPKLHDGRGIRASVEAFGYVEPIVRDERTGRLVAGHGRLAQLRALEAREGRKKRGRKVPDGVRVAGDGRWLVPVVRGWASADDAAAEAYLVASNRLTERGGWDTGPLAELLTAVQDADPALLALTGFDDAALAGLLEAAAAAAAAGGAGGGDPDALPTVSADPVSASGDVWDLGPHRLAVGDATDPKVLAALMGEARATCLFTDPPYGVDYVGKTAAALRIAGDTADGAPQLLADALEVVRAHLVAGAAFYVFHASGPVAVPMLVTLATAPWRLRQTLVWCKSSFVLGHADYHYAHEPIEAGELHDPAVDTSQNATADEGGGRGVRRGRLRTSRWRAGPRAGSARRRLVRRTCGVDGAALSEAGRQPGPSDTETGCARRPADRQFDSARAPGARPVRRVRFDACRLPCHRPGRPARRARPALRRRDLPALAAPVRLAADTCGGAGAVPTC